MAALGGNTARKITPSVDVESTPVIPTKASTTIYQGSALGSSSGAARALVAGDSFLGFALESATGGASDGTVSVKACARGVVTVSAITGASGVGDIGSTVYMSSDNDFTLTSSSNTAIGKILSYDPTNGFTVYFEAATVRSI